jgi:ornithine cyclodeaminase/alanine dehydrogenase-like protein (mu-crystallin family)
VLGILGAGVQARTHIQALSRVRKIQRVKIYSPSGSSAGAIKNDLEGKAGISIEVAPNADEALRDADLVVTATTARTPIVRPELLKPGAHINAVGSHRPDFRELDGATMARAKVVVDSREAMMAECGDILLAIEEKAIGKDHIHAEIGEVLAGKKPGRSSAAEITIYKSVGIAIQDAATANLVYRQALERGVGTHVEI